MVTGGVDKKSYAEGLVEYDRKVEHGIKTEAAHIFPESLGAIEANSPQKVNHILLCTIS